MVVDTSVIVAIIKGEPEAAAFTQLILEADRALLSAGSYVELAAVIDSWGEVAASKRLDELLDALAVEVVSFTPGQARIARGAYARYGRGSGHRANLNFGDCFPYALAVETASRLLFKGDDFAHTDVS